MGPIKNRHYQIVRHGGADAETTGNQLRLRCVHFAETFEPAWNASAIQKLHGEPIDALILKDRPHLFVLSIAQAGFLVPSLMDSTR